MRIHTIYLPSKLNLVSKGILLAWPLSDMSIFISTSVLWNILCTDGNERRRSEFYIQRFLSKRFWYSTVSLYVLEHLNDWTDFNVFCVWFNSSLLVWIHKLAWQNGVRRISTSIIKNCDTSCWYNIGAWLRLRCACDWALKRILYHCGSEKKQCTRRSYKNRS